MLSSGSSGGCTTIFSGASGLLGLLSVYPVGGGHGCEGRDGGVSSGFGELQYSPALVSLMGMSTPKSAPANQKASQCSSCRFQRISTQQRCYVSSYLYVLVFDFALTRRPVSLSRD